jgi:hypothetical protein
MGRRVAALGRLVVPEDDPGWLRYRGGGDLSPGDPGLGHFIAGREPDEGTTIRWLSLREGSAGPREEQHQDHQAKRSSHRPPPGTT